MAAGSPLPPLSRPQLAEARRVRAVELFEEGVSNAEVARAVGVCAESVRRWRRVWEKGGASALRRRASSGRPPKLDDSQVEAVRTALDHGARVCRLNSFAARDYASSFRPAHLHMLRR
ncbi:helix-turn-helix domain-containing protein [Streptomyces sp. NPDC056085]